MINLLAVDADTAAIGVVEAHEQVDDGGLTRACGANDGNRLSRLDLKIQIFDDGFFGDISKADVLDIYVAADILKDFGVGIVCFFRGFVDDAKDALRRRTSRLKLMQNIGKLIDGA